MFTDKMITDALLFALAAHEGQVRKYVGGPYLAHPIRVAQTLSALPEGMSEKRAVIAAALLHDVVEDTPATEADVRAVFGDQVADLVMMVTNASTAEDGNRHARKEIDRLHLAKASNPAKLLKLADLIDNTDSIAQYDPGFCKVYLPEKARLLNVLVPDYDPLGLWTRATDQLLEAANRLSIAL